jgi:hypothetical protein
MYLQWNLTESCHVRDLNNRREDNVRMNLRGIGDGDEDEDEPAEQMIQWRELHEHGNEP